MVQTSPMCVFGNMLMVVVINPLWKPGGNKGLRCNADIHFHNQLSRSSIKNGIVPRGRRNGAAFPIREIEFVA